MPNPSRPDPDNISRPNEIESEAFAEDSVTEAMQPGTDPAEEQSVGSDSATEVIEPAPETQAVHQIAPPVHDLRQRRFTAPGFDAKDSPANTCASTACGRTICSMPASSTTRRPFSDLAGWAKLRSAA